VIWLYYINVKMTSTNVPTAEEFEQIEPDRNSIISKGEDEGVSLTLHIVDGDVIPDSSARTYTRTYGHYFIEKDSKCADILDEILADFTSENGILSSFNRQVFEAYEVMIEVNDIMSDNGEFDDKDRLKLNLNSQSQHMEKVDLFLSALEKEIQS